MEKTPRGTSVGVDDPYAFVDRCDHLTDDGRCRYAAEYAEHDEAFARERRRDDLRCPVGDPDGDWEWADCPHFGCRQRDRECARCGLEERRMALSDERPLLEEHHLQYREGDPGAADGQEPAHEITVYLCRWCHAKVHGSWARVDDDAAPDPAALAEAEERRSRELDEAGFTSAGERFDGEGE
jgi:hypothetical protein